MSALWWLERKAAMDESTGTAGRFAGLMEAFPTLEPAAALGPRILIVDDDPSALARLELSLDGTAGVVVATTTSGLHAIELSQILHPDVALVDLDMSAPGIGGALTAWLLQERAPAVSVILVADEGAALSANDLRLVGAVTQVSRGATPEVVREAILRAAWSPLGPRVR